jgi:hypothetical protein
VVSGAVLVRSTLDRPEESWRVDDCLLSQTLIARRINAQAANLIATMRGAV